MTTTVVRDSIVGDQWISTTAQQVPPQFVIDEKTGEPSTDVLTGPVRLAFDNLFELPKKTETIDNPKYGSTVLFTPYADMQIFYNEYYRVCGEEFREFYDEQSQQYYGLRSPFRDQAEKAKFGGFTPGCIFMTCTSNYKPPVVDVHRNPIVDQSKVYAGVWAICSLNAYAYKDARNKGVAFGLQSVMIIGDDTKFGGGAPDPNKTFSGVSGAITPPAITAGQAGGTPGQPPVAGMPPPPPGGTNAAPPTPGQPPVAPVMPGQPATPPAPAPVAAGDPRGPVPAGFESWAEYDDLMG